MKKATDLFEAGFSCSQAVFGRFAEENGLDYDTALKIASGFGAGMARNEEVCGAVTGGIMALGLRYGRTSDTDSSATYDTYEKVNELTKRFVRENGSYICKNLLGGIDLKTDPDYRKDVKGLRVGVIEELEGEGFAPEVRARFTESLEQLRVLAAGYTILVGVVDEPTFGIDTPEDYRRFVARRRSPLRNLSV